MSAILAALINGGLAGVAVTAAVWAVLSISPRRALNAATRYAVWWATLLVILALPLFYLPGRVESDAPQPSTAPLITQTASTAETVPVVVPDNVPQQPPRRPQFPLELSAGAWPVRIFRAWGIVAAFMMIRLLASYVVLERRKRRAHASDKLQDWPVRALISSEIASPMAAGLFRPAILLPERLLAELRDEELEQIRVHETAHLLRRDDVALLIQRIVEALFALHPVVRWITRRIDLEREIACDDFVLEKTGEARPYASCLTRVVEIAGGARSSIAAAAATEERSHLARRIEMLLDKTRHKGTRLLKIRLLLVAVALMALAGFVAKRPGVVAFADSFYAQPPVPPSAPEPPAPLEPEAVPEAPAPPASPASMMPAEPPAPPAPGQATSMESSNRTMTWRANDGLHVREVRMHGEVHFNDAETDVKSISPDGFFSYEESYGFTSRRYQAQATSSGQIQKRYLVDGREKSFDADAVAWMRAAIPDLLRDSGIDAAERVRRIFRQGGVSAVLTEIGKIRGDGTKKLYIGELLLTAKPTSDQFQSLLRIVRNMGSDGEKAAVLTFLSPNILKDGLRDYAFEALKTIRSDGEKHRVLTEFISHDSSRGTLTLAARAAADINSDGEKSAVLLNLAPYLRNSADLQRPFFRAAETIHSDGERARVLTAVMASAGEQPFTLIEALRAAQAINSDGEKARVLVHADGYWKDDELLRRTYFQTAGSVHSDGEKARVLTSLIGRGGLADRTLIEAVHCAAGIRSDGEKGRVLVAIAHHSNGKSEVRNEIKTAAQSIHSDGEYRRVMAAIDLGALPNRAQAR
jgi:beta-lactamase regulating signal transducer with metallopeptidase domain